MLTIASFCGLLPSAILGTDRVVDGGLPGRLDAGGRTQSRNP